MGSVIPRKGINIISLLLKPSEKQSHYNGTAILLDRPTKPFLVSLLDKGMIRTLFNNDILTTAYMRHRFVAFS